MPTPREKTRPTERDDTAEIHPSMRASIAVATILTGFHRVLNAKEAGVIANRDSEFLHDFRVALRTSRSVLTETQGVFPKRSFRRFKSYLTWLARISSAPRDLDVFLLASEREPRVCFAADFNAFDRRAVRKSFKKLFRRPPS
jgi:CHAD domain-containing protein